MVKEREFIKFVKKLNELNPDCTFEYEFADPPKFTATADRIS